MSKKNVKILNLNPSGRCIVIGDLHGCFDEFMALLKKINFGPSDTLILTGDIPDRGPKIAECFDYARTFPNIHYLMGNHDSKLYRYLNNNPCKVGYLIDTLEQCPEYLDRKFRDWLRSLPYIISFGNNYVVHAGIHPFRPPQAQGKEDCLFRRTFSSEKRDMWDIGTPKWYHSYYGPDTIIFGHDPHDNYLTSEYTMAADGGAVFGGVLRALIFEDHMFTECVEVPSPEYSPSIDEKTIWEEMKLKQEAFNARKN